MSYEERNEQKKIYKDTGQERVKQQEDERRENIRRSLEVSLIHDQNLNNHYLEYINFGLSY